MSRGSTSSMGPVLRGWTPPFTPSGKSAYWPFPGEGYPGVEPIHNGIFIKFEVDPDEVAKLLPAPLKIHARTNEATIFINQTILLPTGLGDVSEVEPDATKFMEALITFDCDFNGRRVGFHYIMYTDSDWCLYCGPIAGLTTKLADIRLLAPTPHAHPNWGLDKPGSLLKASVSRGGERLIAATFTVGDSIVDAADVFEDMTEIIGMRYFPDQTQRHENKPLVHDLVLQDPVKVSAGTAYTGTGTLEFNSTITDELHFFTPRRIIDAHYLTGFSHNNLGLKVVYDYLEEH